MHQHEGDTEESTKLGFRHSYFELDHKGDIVPALPNGMRLGLEGFRRAN